MLHPRVNSSSSIIFSYEARHLMLHACFNSSEWITKGAQAWLILILTLLCLHHKPIVNTHKLNCSTLEEGCTGLSYDDFISLFFPPFHRGDVTGLIPNPLEKSLCSAKRVCVRFFKCKNKLLISPGALSRQCRFNC